MTNQSAAIMDRVVALERNLQALKLEVFLRSPKKAKKEQGIYKEEGIINEVRRIRRSLWNEKYSKAA